jgi:VanZ family protein
MRSLRGYRYYQMIGFAYIAVIIYLTLTPNPPAGPDVPYADKWEHFLAYGLMMAWFGQFLAPGRQRWRWAAAFVAMGGLLEILQGLGGVRHAEWADFAANTTGVALGYLAALSPLGRSLAFGERKFLR